MPQMWIDEKPTDGYRSLEARMRQTPVRLTMKQRLFDAAMFLVVALLIGGSAWLVALAAVWIFDQVAR